MFGLQCLPLDCQIEQGFYMFGAKAYISTARRGRINPFPKAATSDSTGKATMAIDLLAGLYFFAGK